jgi:hypothetical protein
MNAELLIVRIAKTLKECRLECVLIGNAAAALQGVSVSTLDFDFMYRRTELNRNKIRKFAALLGAEIEMPHCGEQASGRSG